MPLFTFTIVAWLAFGQSAPSPAGGNPVEAARMAYAQRDDAEVMRLGDLARNRAVNADTLETLAFALRSAGRQRSSGAADTFGSSIEDGLAHTGMRRSPTVGYALGSWHRNRTNRRDESDRERLTKALSGFDAAVEGYRQEFDLTDGLGQRDPNLALASALEYRGNVLSRLGVHDRGIKDIQDAIAIHERREDPESVHRCQLRAAYAEFLAGAWTESLRHLDEHRRQAHALGLHSRTQQLALRDNELLRALCHIGRRDLADAALALEMEFQHDDLLLAALGIDDLLRSYSRSMISTGEVAQALLDCWRDAPKQRTHTFALASGVFEHGSAKLLRHVLAAKFRAREPVPAPGNPEQSPDNQTLQWPEPTPVLPEHYAPLPPRMAEFRYGEIETADNRKPRYVILARYGDRQVFEELGTVEGLNKRVQTFMARWFTPAALSRDPKLYAQEAAQLRRRIFGNADDWFADEAPPSRVLIMGTGVFGRFPYGALPRPGQASTTEALDQRGYAAIPFLVQTTAFLQAPNLHTLTRLPAPNDSRRTVAILDPALVDATGRPIPSLRFAARELQGLVAAHGDVELLTRDSATVGNVLSEISKGDLRWLHVGCHATPDAGARNRAALLTARKTPDTPPLRVTDVFRAPMTPGCRVVLSACGTSSGDVERGEGILGLWRAFLVAGASCVVSTLYEVDDRAIASWMSEFHQAAADGMPLAHAQRDACLKWINGVRRPKWPRGVAIPDDAHPYLWATTVCLGNDGGELPSIRIPPP